MTVSCMVKRGPRHQNCRSIIVGSRVGRTRATLRPSRKYLVGRWSACLGLRSVGAWSIAGACGDLPFADALVGRPSSRLWPMGSPELPRCARPQHGWLGRCGLDLRTVVASSQTRGHCFILASAGCKNQPHSTVPAGNTAPKYSPICAWPTG